MLIPENGKWRWNDGPLCDTQEEALATATVVATTDAAAVFFVDTAEAMEIDDENDD